MKEGNLVPFSKVKEIISNIDPNMIISYEGSVGTSEQVGVPAYQFIEIRVAFNNGNDGEDSNN